MGTLVDRKALTSTEEMMLRFNEGASDNLVLMA